MPKFLFGKDLDRSIEDIRESSNEIAFNIRLKKFPDALRGIAEGDSWFDYLPAWAEDPTRGDLINQLNLYTEDNDRKFNIFRVAEAGDTVENMVFGHNTDQNSRPEENQLGKILRLIGEYKPAFFLFSGGGNDIVGETLDSLVNHAVLEDNLGLIRTDNFDYILNKVFKDIFEYLISEITLAKPDIHIFVHGYGYAIPNGKPVIGVPRFGFIGPWMAPTFARKQISLAKGEKIIQELIDLFNDFLKKIANSHPNVHYLDLRNIIKPNDWANELHLTVDGYEKVAREYINHLDSVFPKKAPNKETSPDMPSTTNPPWIQPKT